MTALPVTALAKIALPKAALAASLALVLAAPASAASFDCATARAADETAVCGNCDLAQLDVKMATLYGVLGHLVPMGQRSDLQDAQRGFLAQRANCGGDDGCLGKAYRARIGELEQSLARIYARGPF